MQCYGGGVYLFICLGKPMHEVFYSILLYLIYPNGCGLFEIDPAPNPQDIRAHRMKMMKM